jgi:hypothetical integral membrane protein (TIGR02206 family)
VTPVLLAAIQMPVPPAGLTSAESAAALASESAASSFHSFSATHALVVLVCATAVGVSCALGRAWRRAGPFDTREGRLATAWGGFVLAINLWSWVYWFLPARFNVQESLPLQLCDIACITAALAYLTRWRWCVTLTYFWGLGLSSQAFITPTLTNGPGHMEFWLFWLVHLAIVGSAVYHVAVWKYRPGTRDLGLAIGVSLVWLGAMLVVNAYLGSNYGYVANTRPDRPTVIDALGPWPFRVVLLAAIAIGIFILLWAIWRPWRTRLNVPRRRTV